MTKRIPVVGEVDDSGRTFKGWAHQWVGPQTSFASPGHWQHGIATWRPERKGRQVWNGNLPTCDDVKKFRIYSKPKANRPEIPDSSRGAHVFEVDGGYLKKWVAERCAKCAHGPVDVLKEACSDCSCGDRFEAKPTRPAQPLLPGMVLETDSLPRIEVLRIVGAIVSWCRVDNRSHLGMDSVPAMLRSIASEATRIVSLPPPVVGMRVWLPVRKVECVVSSIDGRTVHMTKDGQFMGYWLSLTEWTPEYVVVLSLPAPAYDVDASTYDDYSISGDGEAGPAVYELTKGQTFELSVGSDVWAQLSTTDVCRRDGKYEGVCAIDSDGRRRWYSATDLRYWQMHRLMRVHAA